jgi:predicted metal-binding membrane protein
MDALMGMGSPWTAAQLAATMTMWTVMMVLMMVPASLPVTRLVSRGSRRAAAAGEPATPAAAFMGGYLLAWIAFSAAATMIQSWLSSAMLLTAGMHLRDGALSGAVLVLAGGWQLTPWKNACLSRCSTPLSFALHRWRSGAAGALRMGLEHGFACLGCCWALMLVLFAAGVMNIAAIAGLVVLVIAERTLSFGHALARITGIGLIATGIALFLA